jgi:hexosaminidase
VFYTTRGEQIDPLTYEGQVWPRLSAVAERLWSRKEISSITDAFPRLQRHRCNVFVKRGIRSVPLRPQYCPHAEKLFP